MPHETIAIRGASQHNLKGLDLELPRRALIVVTGPSGSGKSSLAFDTICAEGRRRYLETFSSYARQFLGKVSRPAALGVEGLSPAVAVDQTAVVRSPRSTVGTLTELYDLLRLLWARVGVAPEGMRLPLERRLFSFNSPHGACPACKGLGVEDRVDPELLVADSGRTLREGALRVTTPNGYLMYSQVTLEVLDQVCRAHGFSVDLPWAELTEEQRDVVLRGSDRLRIPYGKHPLSSRLRWTGITARPREEGTYKGILPVIEQILRQKRNPSILRFVRSLPCSACGGSRLREEARAVTVRGRGIAEIAALPIDELRRWCEEELAGAGSTPASAGQAVEAAVRAQVALRGEVLQQLGLGYLTLDRDATTLAGGEAQRLRLARLAGIDLGGVLYVFDEPSLGLHHRDTARLLGVLRRLRDRGNTVLVVEHDEQVMRGADWLVDLGPAAGAAGGELLYCGPASELLAPGPGEPAGPARSRTAAFLGGRERIPVPTRRREGVPLRFTHLTRHNLQGLSVELRAGALNVVTGVSGAGKSTLVEEVLRALRDGLADGPRPDKIIEIDQAPIGRTPRSNPATYTGLFDRVRDLFAAEPEAARRGLGKGSFSFNVKGGRCEVCEGAGVVQVGMHFLGAVAVRCEACGGRRFGEETLAVRHRGRSVAEVLELPIEEAAAFFAEDAALARPLQTLCALGLGYLALGHPATMLSGGEAQRVKLAAELARPGTARTLYVLDEPTTGLHAADLSLLLAALEGLVQRGATVLAVEHHLDVIKVADWVVDLGPGSGAAGGRVVACGPPERVAAAEASLTGAALREVVLPAPRVVEGPPAAPPTPARPAGPPPIRLRGVTTHNLRGVDALLPANQLTVITGVSGSGKSSLAFDTLFAEGQRRFADSFSVYARRLLGQGEEAELEEASGLTPTIAISQHAPSRNPRSSVGTVTDLLDHYRLLYARVGSRACPRCGAAHSGGACACGLVGPRTLTASMFSPNTEQGACPRCAGLGHILACDPARLISAPSRPLAGGAMDGHKLGRLYGDPHGQQMATLGAAAAALGLDLSRPFVELEPRAREVALHGAGELELEVTWEYVRGKRSGTHRFRSRWPGLLELVRQEYERTHADRRGEALEELMAPAPCPACGGRRLRPEALAVRVAGLDLSQLLARTVDENLAFVAGLEEALDAQALAVTRELRAEATRRLQRLRDAGLEYLTLDRPASTLSGGEAQRVRLASQLGAGLTGITYVLDEPTLGLHPRDTRRLIGLLHGLRDAGNTVVVVEHDPEVMAAADHLIEVGPGAGSEGGRIVAQGPPAAVLGARPPELRPERPPRSLSPGISLRAATAHNLQALDLELPAGGLIVVTGVSGSGKSSLVFEVLAPSLERALASGGASSTPVGCRELVLHAPFAEIVRVGRSSLRTSPWSNPATVTGLAEPLRALFAESEEARARGLRKQHFSTQARGGRCEACEGIGRLRVAMDFLPDVWVTCEDCGGRGYGPEVLACTVAGHSIAELLALSVEAAAALASELPGRRASELTRGLAVLGEVGLGYLRLGQPARTLSGGERQRLLLAAALLERRGERAGPALYLFDEPTTGLHARDVARLLEVFDRLVAAGHTLLVIEHQLDVIRAADWVIDLGPEGGRAGGRLVAAGPPAAIAACEASHTGRALAR